VLALLLFLPLQLRSPSFPSFPATALVACITAWWRRGEGDGDRGYRIGPARLLLFRTNYLIYF